MNLWPCDITGEPKLDYPSPLGEYVVIVWIYCFETKATKKNVFLFLRAKVSSVCTLEQQ